MTHDRRADRWRELVARAGRGTRPTRAQVVWTLLVLPWMLTAVVFKGAGYAWPEPPLLVLTVLGWLPLLGRTRWPLATVAATVVVSVVQLVVVPVPPVVLTDGIAMGALQPVPIATMVATWTLAVRAPRPVAWGAAGVSSAVLLVTSVLTGTRELLVTDLMIVNLVCLATGAGTVVAARRERRERLLREREERTREAVTDERLRIARELHDVLAHNLVLVNAQAGVASFLLRTDPDGATRALDDITRHTSRAIDDLRATVGLLRRDGAAGADGTGTGTAEGGTADDGERYRPVPGLDRLPALVASLETTGTTVTLTEHGTPVALGEPGGVAAYRIVQEALTNAAKHAPGARVAVRLDWTDDGLDVSVRNGPGTRPVDAAPGTGNGLLGMRERARAAGGTFTVERPADGGFAVVAHLPGLAARSEQHR